MAGPREHSTEEIIRNRAIVSIQVRRSGFETYAKRMRC